MAEIGHHNSLRIVREAPPGLYLDGGTHGEILLPRRYIPAGAVPGERLDVFVHRDSEDRLVATTETPLAVVGECACMEVVAIDPRVGAFLAWGLAKDLLLPEAEQERRVKKGDRVVVIVYFDEFTGRIAASTRLAQHLHKATPPYAEGERVRLLIATESPLGYTAVIEGEHLGLLYRTELSGAIEVGQQLDGYIRTVRPDGKIDLRIDASGYERVALLTERILTALTEAGGHLPFSDTSTPAEIRTAFGISKKAFKQALGALYRERRIRLTEAGIELVPKSDRKP